MDIKSDIMIQIPNFLETINVGENKAFQANNAAVKVNKKVQPVQPKPASNKKSDQKKYCILCVKAGLSKQIFLSHNIGDDECPTLSNLDKKKLETKFSLNRIQEEQSEDEDEIAELFGYPSVDIKEEVKCPVTSANNTNVDRMVNEPRLTLLKTVPTQILTMYALQKK